MYLGTLCVPTSPPNAPTSTTLTIQQHGFAVAVLVTITIPSLFRLAGWGEFYFGGSHVWLPFLIPARGGTEEANPVLTVATTPAPVAIVIEVTTKTQLGQKRRVWVFAVVLLSSVRDPVPNGLGDHV